MNLYLEQVSNPHAPPITRLLMAIAFAVYQGMKGL